MYPNSSILRVVFKNTVVTHINDIRAPCGALRLMLRQFTINRLHDASPCPQLQMMLPQLTNTAPKEGGTVPIPRDLQAFCSSTCRRSHRRSASHDCGEFRSRSCRTPAWRHIGGILDLQPQSFRSALRSSSDSTRPSRCPQTEVKNAHPGSRSGLEPWASRITLDVAAAEQQQRFTNSH